MRCRQLARKRFIDIKNDVLAKIELLENKHVYNIVGQLHVIASQMASYNNEISQMMLGKENDHNEHQPPLFPIQLNLTHSAFQYKSVQSAVS